MIATTKFLDKLERVAEVVTQTSPNTWKASCPTHADKNPSLSIKEASDGKVLIHCLAGCQTVSVLEACDATFSDLFPDDKD